MDFALKVMDFVFKMAEVEVTVEGVGLPPIRADESDDQYGRLEWKRQLVFVFSIENAEIVENFP